MRALLEVVVCDLSRHGCHEMQHLLVHAEVLHDHRLCCRVLVLLNRPRRDLRRNGQARACVSRLRVYKGLVSKKKMAE